LSWLSRRISNVKVFGLISMTFVSRIGESDRPLNHIQRYLVTHKIGRAIDFLRACGDRPPLRLRNFILALQSLRSLAPPYRHPRTALPPSWLKLYPLRSVTCAQCQVDLVWSVDWSNGARLTNVVKIHVLQYVVTSYIYLSMP
jgi:hypothetical protein